MARWGRSLARRLGLAGWFWLGLVGTRLVGTGLLLGARMVGLAWRGRSGAGHRAAGTSDDVRSAVAARTSGSAVLVLLRLGSGLLSLREPVCGGLDAGRALEPAAAGVRGARSNA